MEARIDLQQTFYSPKAIQVVVVPIGEISPFKFNFYLNLLRNSSACDLEEVVSGGSSGPLPNRNWRDAKIYLNFHPVIDRSRDEIVDTWGNFQAHRKTYCVVGIVLCNQFPDLSIAKNQFLSILKSYPSSIVSKCFAFEPMADQPDLPGGESLVMIPNGDVNRLNFYIRTQVYDLTATILKTIEAWLSGTKEPKEEAAAFISTLLDSQETDSEGIGKLKKRKQGRLQKIKGDWCLLAGSPSDAITYYNSAIELTKSNSDRIWLGGAIEGYLASILIQNSDQPFQVANPEEPTDEVIEKSKEALGHYNKRKITPLVAELSFKLVRYHIQAGRKKEASTLLMECFDLTNDIQLSSKIEICATIALLFEKMEYHRKFAFFIRETAVLYHKAHNSAAAHLLLNNIAKHYQLSELDETYSALSRKTRSLFGDADPFNPNARRPLKDKSTRDWGYIQKIMLQNLVRTSKGINDPHSLVRFSIHLLKMCSGLLSSNAQLQYVAELQAAVQSLPSVGFGAIEADTIGLPRLKKITPLGISENYLEPVSTELSGTSIFLYTPYKKKSGNQMTAWVQGEIAQIKVELANDSMFDIPVQSISLSTSGVQFEAYSSGFIIPAHTPSYEATITGRPLGPKGVLLINGCIIRVYNLLCEFPVNEHCIGIPIKEYQHMVQFPTKIQKNAIGNKVTVLTSLPLLSVREENLYGNTMQLTEGQKLITNIVIENIGTLPIDSIDIGLEIQTDIAGSAPSYYELGDDMDPFKWDNDIIKRHLPLLPGQRFIFPIEIQAKMGVASGDFSFAYLNQSNADFARAVTLRLPLEVREGLRESHFDILSCFPTSFIDEKSQKDLYLRNDSCLLVFDISNRTTNNFLVNCTVTDDPTRPDVITFSRQIASEPNSVKKACVPLKRFTLDESNLHPMKELKTQYIKPAEALTPAQEREVRTLYWYKYEILKRVKITWFCPAFNTVGNFDFLPKMILTRPIIEKVKADIASFEFVLSGVSRLEAAGEDDLEKESHPASKVYYPIRQFKSIKFLVKNITPGSMPVNITVQPFQDLENGIRNTNLGGKLAWTGILDKKLPDLKSGETYEFDLTVCFLAYGTYHFVVCCENQVTRTMSCSQVLQIRVF